MLDVARKHGGQYLIVALCMRAAYHAVGRPDEMRELLRSAVSPDGINIPIGKRKKGQPQRYKLAEWNKSLKEAIDEALKLPKTSSIYVFPNARGGAYNRNSWANRLKPLMDYCEEAAAKEGRPFQRFTLADIRPTSITERMDKGDDRITDATGHKDVRMVNKVYDGAKFGDSRQRIEQPSSKVWKMIQKRIVGMVVSY